MQVVGGDQAGHRCRPGPGSGPGTQTGPLAGLGTGGGRHEDVLCCLSASPQLLGVGRALLLCILEQRPALSRARLCLLPK